MNLTQLIPKDLKSLSIIGLSKNAGKTTVCNALTKQMRNRYKLGLVSVGVDGEEHDVWSHRSKPDVVIPQGSIVATTGSVLDCRPGEWELLSSLGMNTTGERLFVAQAKTRVKVKLMGVSSTSQLKHVLSHFDKAGVEFTLVDGAYDRKASASPCVTQGALLVAGASMDISLERIVSKVEALVHALTLPPTVFCEAGQRAQREHNVMIVQDTGIKSLPVSSLFPIKEFLKNIPKKGVTCIATSGAITDVMIRGLIEDKIGVTVVIPDATHLFVSRSLLRQFYQKGGLIEVMSPVRLVGVAINPTSPEGYAFSSAVMKEEMKRICPFVPIFDVVKEGIPSGP